MDIENRTDPYEAFPADPCQGVVDGALEPVDAPFHIQAEWEQQPPPLTRRRYVSYFILKVYVAMLAWDFFSTIATHLHYARRTRR